jgi:hypothetical protein
MCPASVSPSRCMAFCLRIIRQKREKEHWAQQADKSSPKKVAAKVFILQGGAEPLSSVPVWRSPVSRFSETGVLPPKGAESRMPLIPFIRRHPSPVIEVQSLAPRVVKFEQEVQNMKTLYVALVVVGLVSFRMLFINSAWSLFPKSWQLWLMGRS